MKKNEKFNLNHALDNLSVCPQKISIVIEKSPDGDVDTKYQASFLFMERMENIGLYIADLITELDKFQIRVKKIALESMYAIDEMSIDGHFGQMLGGTVSFDLVTPDETDSSSVKQNESSSGMREFFEECRRNSERGAQ